MITQMEEGLGIDDWRIWTGALRDHMGLKYVPALVSGAKAG